MRQFLQPEPISAREGGYEADAIVAVGDEILVLDVGADVERFLVVVDDGELEAGLFGAQRAEEAQGLRVPRGADVGARVAISVGCFGQRGFGGEVVAGIHGDGREIDVVPQRVVRIAVRGAQGATLAVIGCRLGESAEIIHDHPDSQGDLGGLERFLGTQEIEFG